MVRVVLLLSLVAAAGCDKLFSVTHVSDPTTGTVDGSIDARPVSSCFDGTFDSGSIDPAILDVSQGQATVVPENMAVTIHLVAGVDAPNYASVETQLAYDFTGGSTEVELLEVPGDNAEAELILIRDSSHKVGMSVTKAATTIFVYNGSTTIYQEIGTFPTATGPARFARITHDPFSKLLEYGISLDGKTWKTELHDVLFPVDAMRASFDAGTYGAATAPGQARFDNFVLRSSDCL